MQSPKVKFIYKNLDLFVKLSVLIKKIVRISPYICCFSVVIGVIDILLKENIPGYLLKENILNYVRLIYLVTFGVSFLMFFISFFLEYIFMFLWKCPKCKGKFPWYKTTLGYLGEEGGSLINKSVKDICDRRDKKITLIQYENSNLLIPKKCPHCKEAIWENK